MKKPINKKTADEVIKIKDLIDEQRKLIRGEKGKFVSLKKLEKEKELPLTHPVKKTFFGKEIRIYYVGDKVYFAIDDIIATATPFLSKETIEYTEEYETIRQSIAKKIGDIEVADANSILRLIKEVKGEFPGPLSRWLKEN